MSFERRSPPRSDTMSKENEELDDLRVCIDRIDAQLLKLINERARLAQAIAAVKRGGSAEAELYRPEREAQILRRIVDSNEGPLADPEVARLLREIMSACLALEQPVRVSYLGPRGTFTEAAALKHFGGSVSTVPATGIDEVFHAVETGACNFGVVPVENSIEGAVNHTLDCFIDSPLRICGEVELQVHHQLLSAASDVNAVRRVYAHQQAIAQCRRWLDKYLPGVERLPVSSNAEAARRAAAQSGAAAIAGETAARYYGLPILAANIEDHPENTTRFAVIGRLAVPPSGHDRTSILFSVQNKPGALYHVLQAVAEAGISMTRIESRPSKRGTWDYDFFVDIDGHAEDPAVAAALEGLKSRATMMKLLGSYPQTVL